MSHPPFTIFWWYTAWHFPGCRYIRGSHYKHPRIVFTFLLYIIRHATQFPVNCRFAIDLFDRRPESFQVCKALCLFLLLVLPDRPFGFMRRYDSICSTEPTSSQRSISGRKVAHRLFMITHRARNGYSLLWLSIREILRPG